ncbi:MAG: hypothetical protein ABTD50_23520 [Polyangiaceae bacterium]
MTTAKGGRPATGAVKWTKDKARLERWHGRVTMPDGKRQFVPLDPAIPRTDEARARACAVQTAEFFRTAGVVKAEVKETVAEYAGRWLDDREGRVNSIRDDRSLIRDHVLPVLGPLDVRTFTRDDVERLRDALDAKIVKGELAWKTVAFVWMEAIARKSSGSIPPICSSSSWNGWLFRQRTRDRIASVRRTSRQGVRMKVPNDERSSYPHRPRVMRQHPQGCGRSVDRGTHRPAIEPRNTQTSERRRCGSKRKAVRAALSWRDAVRLCAV